MRNIIEKIKLLEEDVRMGNYCSDEYEDYEEELLDLEDRSYDETLVMENYYHRNMVSSSEYLKSRVCPCFFYKV